MSCSSNPLRVAIIGGGIVGMTLAVPLARAQKQGLRIEVRVYESAHAFGEIGAGVAVGPNAQRILRRLDMGESLDNQVDRSLRPEFHDRLFDIRRGDRGLSRDDSLVSKVEGKNAGLGAVHRAVFLDTLVKMFPAEQVSFGKRLAHYVDIQGSPIKLVFVDGTTADADVVIGCDGIKSVVRRCVFADDTTAGAPEGKATRLRYSTFMNYRALVPTEKYRQTLGDLASDSVMWVGKDRHLLTLPIRSGELMNIVASLRDREGKLAQGKTGPWSDVVPKEVVQEAFGDANDQIKTILSEIDSAMSWGIFELPEIPWYNSGRVAIAGDAAHASTPFLAAGAGSGMEDAFMLYSLLTCPQVLASPEKAIPIALEAYSHVRRPRATLIQRTSAEQGMLYQCRLPGIMDDFQKMAGKLAGRFSWIWEYDEEQAVREALDFFNATFEAPK